jgi:hypothetical protein
MIKNFNNILSELSVYKHSTLEIFFNKILMPLRARTKSFIQPTIFFFSTKTSLKSYTAFVSASVLFEPLEQFEIVSAQLNPYISLLGFFSSSHVVPTAVAISFFVLLFGNFSVYSNFFIVNLVIFKLIRNLFSVNVGNAAKNQKAFFLFYSVFIFILYHNFCGMAPFTYTTTALIVTSFLLSMTVFFYVCIKSVLQNG